MGAGDMTRFWGVVDYQRPTARDLEAASLRRSLDAQAARLEGRDPELAAMVTRLRDAALRSTESGARA